jgi:hypothetical protein
MTRARAATAFLLLALLLAGSPSPAAEGEAARIDARFQDAAAALRALAEGSRITLTTPDAASLRFQVEGGALHPQDFAAREVEESSAIRTPGGYRIGLEKMEGVSAPTLAIGAPSETISYFWFSRAGTNCAEDDGRIWQVGNDVILIFLPDGTRIDLDRPARVVQINSGGSAWRMTRTGFAATEERSPALDAPFFLAIYQTGNGDDWSRMADATLLVRPWEDMPRPLPIDEILGGVRELPWKPWLDATLARLPNETDPEEAASYVLASYFSMPPGSRVALEGKRGKSPRTFFMLPGTMIVPREGTMRMEGASPRLGFSP